MKCEGSMMNQPAFEVSNRKQEGLQGEEKAQRYMREYRSRRKRHER